MALVRLSTKFCSNDSSLTHLAVPHSCPTASSYSESFTISGTFAACSIYVDGHMATTCMDGDPYNGFEFLPWWAH